MKKLIIYSVVFILLLPLMFMTPHDEGSFLNYLLKCALPAMMVVIFWANYLWILPALGRHGRKKRAALQNVLLLLACSAVLALTHWGEMRNREEHFPPPPHHEMRHGNPPTPSPIQPDRARKVLSKPNTVHFVIFTGLRDVLYLILGIMVAYALLASRRMERLQQEQQEAELARKKAELRSLRNHVSPHFLLNTLNNIYTLSVTGSERTSDAVMRLSQLLRHTLYDSRAEHVSLKDEAEFIQSYVELMRLRLAANIQVTTELRISEESTTQVVPLIFLSLVENAFKHGTAPMEPCHIHIALSEDGTHIHFLTRNSLHPKSQDDRSGHGIGLEVVEKRLGIYYPGLHTWHYGPQGDEWVSELVLTTHHPLP